MNTREKAEIWITQMGGVLMPNDQVKMWCHEDDAPSGKLYDNHRVHCFACNKTFFFDTKPANKRSKDITRQEYDIYRISTSQTHEWPILSDVKHWLQLQKELEGNG